MFSVGQIVRLNEKGERVLDGIYVEGERISRKHVLIIKDVLPEFYSVQFGNNEEQFLLTEDEFEAWETKPVKPLVWE